MTQEHTWADNTTLVKRLHRGRDLDALERISAVRLLFGVRREEAELIHIVAGAEVGQEAVTVRTLLVANMQSELDVKHEDRTPERPNSMNRHIPYPRIRKEKEPLRGQWRIRQQLEDHAVSEQRVELNTRKIIVSWLGP